MLYKEIVEVYEKIGSVSGRLEKIRILSEFLHKLSSEGKSEWIYLLKGKVVADYDSREYGISRQLAFKAIALSFGIAEGKVVERFNKVGDLGEIAYEFSLKKKQSALFSKRLDIDKVFGNLTKIMEVEGKGAVERKMSLISELLAGASEDESKYIIRTLLQDLRVGMADGVIKEAITLTFFEGEKEMSQKIEEAYDLVSDFAEIFDAAKKGKKELEKIGLVPGRPINVMLAVKAEDITEAFEICGRPAAIEEKYDGFRVIISKDKKGKIDLFTRKQEKVTAQFPDVVDVVKGKIKGENFILDGEIVGYDPKTKKYTTFQNISQRIRRKYDIDKLVKELPVEVNIFDCMYLNGKSIINLSFRERRKFVESIVKEEKLVIRPAVQIITDSEEEAMQFYENALAIGEEGIMIKTLDAQYKQGRRVGYMCKLKPETHDFDLVIVGAEYGSGKRAGWLTSFIVACNNRGEFLEVGKVSSGLKEKESEGTTYQEMTDLLKPLITDREANIVKVKPKLVVSVKYQDIQESPSYTSNYALRFPRIVSFRPDRKSSEITTLDEVEKEFLKAKSRR